MASVVRNAVRPAQFPLEDALPAASLTPARFLGLDNERGALISGFAPISLLSLRS